MPSRMEVGEQSERILRIGHTEMFLSRPTPEGNELT